MPRQISDNVFEDEQGRRFALPEFGSVARLPAANAPGFGAAPATAAFGPSCSGNTGPYRRVFSQPGYGWMSAYVYLPAGGDVAAAQNTNDTAFVYTGGWGGPRNAGGGPGSGDAVDAGFQHSFVLTEFGVLGHLSAGAGALVPDAPAMAAFSPPCSETTDPHRRMLSQPDIDGHPAAGTAV